MRLDKRIYKEAVSWFKLGLRSTVQNSRGTACFAIFWLPWLCLIHLISLASPGIRVIPLQNHRHEWVSQKIGSFQVLVHLDILRGIIVRPIKPNVIASVRCRNPKESHFSFKKKRRVNRKTMQNEQYDNDRWTSLNWHATNWSPMENHFYLSSFLLKALSHFRREEQNKTTTKKNPISIF